ncbi:MAG: N2227-like protein-domain-containing protein, partial [Olpidium bornovanus]
MAAGPGEPAVDARGAGRAGPASVLEGGRSPPQTAPGGGPHLGPHQLHDCGGGPSSDPDDQSDEEGGGGGAPSEAEKERRHFERVVLAFKNYAQGAQISNIRRRRDLQSLPARHRNLVPLQAVEKRLDDADEAIRLNQTFLSLVVEGSDDVFGLEAKSAKSGSSTRRRSGRLPKVRAADFDKVRSTLKQFVRDWSDVGKPERLAAYGPILRELEEWFKDTTMEQSHSNVLSAQQQLQRVCLPDVVLDLPEGSDFSMVAGDFLEVYGKPDMHGGLKGIFPKLTCFFLDTARNVAHYLEIMYNALKPGGVWINLGMRYRREEPVFRLSTQNLKLFNARHHIFGNEGPLLYHFEDMPGESSIELTLEELLEAVQLIGFRILVRFADALPAR